MITLKELKYDGDEEFIAFRFGERDKVIIILKR